MNTKRKKINNKNQINQYLKINLSQRNQKLKELQNRMNVKKNLEVYLKDQDLKDHKDHQDLKDHQNHINVMIKSEVSQKDKKLANNKNVIIQIMVIVVFPDNKKIQNLRNNASLKLFPMEIAADKVVILIFVSSVIINL